MLPEWAKWLILVLFAGIDLACLCLLVWGWRTSNFREKTIDLVNSLHEAFQQRVPSGWLFYDGEGRF